MAVDTEALKGGDILGGIGLGGGSFNLGSLGTIFLWGIAFIIILGLLAWGVIWFVSRKQYSQKIWIFSRIAGVPMLKFIDNGKFVAFGGAGDRLLQLKKLKKFLPVPQIQMGKNIFWFYEREDGEYINFSLTDIDAMQKKAGAYYVDTDMRMQRLGIEKNLRERLTKLSFFEKYGQAIAGVIFVIMVTVSLVVLFSQLKDVTTALDGTAQSVGQMASAVELFYTARTGGEAPSDVWSGLVPVLILFIIGRKKWFQKQ